MGVRALPVGAASAGAAGMAGAAGAVAGDDAAEGLADTADDAAAQQAATLAAHRLFVMPPPSPQRSFLGRPAEVDTVGVIRDVTPEPPTEGGDAPPLGLPGQPLEALHPVLQFARDRYARFEQTGSVVDYAISRLWLDTIYPVFAQLTSAHPVHVLYALSSLLDSEQYLRRTYIETHAEIPSEWNRVLDPVRALATSDTVPIFIKAAALKVWVATDTAAATQVLLDIALDDTADAELRFTVFPIFGRLQRLPSEAQSFLHSTAHDATVPDFVRTAAIQGLTHLSQLNNLTRLAITDENKTVRKAAEEAVRSLLARFGNDTPGAMVAFETVRGYFSDNKYVFNAVSLSLAWGERAIPVLADLHDPRHPISILWGILPLQDDPDIAAAVLRLLAHPSENLRRTLAGSIIPFFGLEGAVAAVGMLDHEDNEARQSATELVQKAGLPVLDYDAPGGYTKSRRAEFVERLVGELQRITRPTSEDSNRPMGHYRPSTAQVLHAIGLVGLEAWNALQRARIAAAHDDPMRPYLDQALASIARRAIPNARERFMSRDQKVKASAAQDFITMGAHAVPSVVDILMGDDPVAAEYAGVVLMAMGIPAYNALRKIDSAIASPIMQRIGSKIAEVFADPAEAARYPDGRYTLDPEGEGE